jgi:hypothetical protein
MRTGVRVALTTERNARSRLWWRHEEHSVGSTIVDERHPNLADPSYEPSDEELQGLANRAFAGLREAEIALQEKLRHDIAREREHALARLQVAGPRR